jgi:type II secretory pathway pseudopilin PulG
MAFAALVRMQPQPPGRKPFPQWVLLVVAIVLLAGLASITAANRARQQRDANQQRNQKFYASIDEFKKRHDNWMTDSDPPWKRKR